MPDGVSAYTIAEYVETWGDVERNSAALVGLALADRLALVEQEEPGFTGDMLDEIGPDGSLMLAYDREFWLRPKQLFAFRSVATWRILLFIAGRRCGKTLTATEWIVWRLECGAREIVIVGPTYDDAKQFMLGGHKRRCDAENGSGILDVLPPWIRYHYKEDEGVVEFPDFKCVLRLWSGELPEYRGPGPDSVWGDEVLKWRYPERLISNLRIACSSGGRVKPQLVFTSTPRKLKILRDLVMDPDVVTLTADSNENSGNVDETWRLSENRRLRGTKQGDEELGGKLGVDEEGAIFQLGIIDAHRVDRAPELDLIMVAIDPAGSVQHTSDPTGIVVVGRAGDIHTGQAYVLAEDTKRHAWEAWGVRAWVMLEEHGGSAFVIEKNYGADACAANLRTAGAARGYEARARPGFKHLVDMVHKLTGRVVQIHEVLAKGDKATRARPIATLYERGRAHHVGHLTALETEMSDWDPATGNSPNGLDALVHAMTELFQLDRAPDRTGSATATSLVAANERLAAAAPSRGCAWVSGGASRRRTI